MKSTFLALIFALTLTPFAHADIQEGDIPDYLEKKQAAVNHIIHTNFEVVHLDIKLKISGSHNAPVYHLVFSGKTELGNGTVVMGVTRVHDPYGQINSALELLYKDWEDLTGHHLKVTIPSEIHLGEDKKYYQQKILDILRV